MPQSDEMISRSGSMYLSASRISAATFRLDDEAVAVFRQDVARAAIDAFDCSSIYSVTQLDLGQSDLALVGK
jgi:hypothetical protein